MFVCIFNIFQLLDIGYQDYKEYDEEETHELDPYINRDRYHTMEEYDREVDDDYQNDSTNYDDDYYQENLPRDQDLTNKSITSFSLSPKSPELFSAEDGEPISLIQGYLHASSLNVPPAINSSTSNRPPLSSLTSQFPSSKPIRGNQDVHDPGLPIRRFSDDFDERSMIDIDTFTTLSEKQREYFTEAKLSVSTPKRNNTRNFPAGSVIVSNSFESGNLDNNKPIASDTTTTAPAITKTIPPPVAPTIDNNSNNNNNNNYITRDTNISQYAYQIFHTRSMLSPDGMNEGFELPP